MDIKVKKMNLSKSKFLAGMQCPKRLYLLCYQPELAEKPDEQLQALFAQGQEVGRLVQKAYPAGVLLSENYLDHREAVSRTRELMADRKVPALFEGAFSFEDIYIRVDILKRLPGNRWRLIEVKSSARVDEKHIPDVAIQKYVVEQCGYKVADAWLMHLNRQYLYDGKNYNLKKLFTLHNLNKEIRIFKKELPVYLAEQWKVLSLKKAPDVEYGTRCNTPFACEFYAFCHKEVPDDWVGDLPGIGKRTDLLAFPPAQLGRGKTLEEAHYLVIFQRRECVGIHCLNYFLRDMRCYPLSTFRYYVPSVETRDWTTMSAKSAS